MEPATEAKKLRQLCKLLRAELAAKVSSAANSVRPVSCTPWLLHLYNLTPATLLSSLGSSSCCVSNKHDLLFRRARQGRPFLRWMALMRSALKPSWLSECAPSC